MRPAPKALKPIIVLLVCFIIVCAACAGALLGYQYATRPEPVVKKAFIMLPGLMGSCLCDPEYDNAVVWSANPNWLLTNENIKTNPNFLTDYVTEFFKFDNNGVPLKQMNPADAATSQGNYLKDRYSFNGMTEYASKYLIKEYADDGYDVITWQYDWRQSNEATALKLEEFINSNGYTNIIFLSHSMGGNVIAKYLGKEENRAKVDLFIPFAAPFLGSLDTIDWLFQKDESITTEFDNIFTAIMLYLNVYEYASDMPTLAQLLPYAAMSQLSVFGENDSPILLNHAKVTFNELYQYLCSQSFAKTDSLALKPIFKNLVEYQKKDFIGIDGVYRHISDFVDTVYVVGKGKETRYMTNIDTATGKITEYYKTDLGDGTVWAYSGTAGHALDSDNVIVIDGNIINYNGHGGMMETPEIFNLVKPVIEAHILHATVS